MRRGLGWSGWAMAALLSAGIALYAYRYLLHVGVLAANVLENSFVHPWLELHVAGAATALLLGPLQFLPALRRRSWHRWSGRVYVLGCLGGGIGGFFLALGSTAGPVATAGFGSLALLWLGTTAQAWRRARARDFAAHRAWMIRSFALTFAAVTLRLYLPLVFLTGLPVLDSYRAIAFLCWVPNLILAELYLRGTFRRHKLSAI